MKAYVIKNNEGLYYTTHLNYEDIHTEDISEASIYDRKIANDIKLFLDKTTCQYGEKWEVVEITIAEGDLEQQLVEKDKENERLKEEICKYEITLMDKNSQLKQQDQDKISFAIAELEKVKEHFINIKTPTLGVIRRAEMVMYIDNQIKQLKEGN